MNVGSVSSAGSLYGNLQAKAVQPQGEAAEATKVGRDNDGDADDQAGASTVQAPPASVVNLNGQKVGQVINVTA